MTTVESCSPDRPKNTGEVIAEERISEWKRDPTSMGDPRDLVFKRFGAKTRVLALSNLGLEQVPESIRELHEIEGIDLTGNKLRELPPWIGELTALKGLTIEFNQLRTLPQEIGALVNLRLLSLHRNHLHQLPDSLQALPLTELNLTANTALVLPDSILRRSPREILSYYFESRADSRPLLELRLMVVGPPRAGKTTLVKRLSGETPNESEPETHSIDIRELKIRCPRDFVCARSWDFGGQDILHPTHQIFLTERCLYLLVLEPRSGLAQRHAEYWLKLVETQGRGSPVIIVLNWSHKRPWRVDDVKLRRKFPFIVDFINTDALCGDGIEDVRRTIATTVEEQMPDVWLPFPRRWRSIKDTVAKMPDNFLTYSDYTNLCTTLDEPRAEKQANLAGILHALGLALYFGEDPRLRDTRVLNPGWVTGGFYAVIRASCVAESDGQLAVTDMQRVLLEAEAQKTVKASDYPPHTHSFLLELMRAFQLCYASAEENGKPTKYLVPDLLPEFEPAMKEAWETAQIRLRYRYDVLPPGLVSRFIVRTHALSEDAPHWRHGVVLRHDGAQALIREESDKSELHVFVLHGAQETRQVLVAIVRRELETLHAEMKMQAIEELELTGEGEQWISVKALRDVEESGKPKQKMAVQPEGTADVFVSRELDKLVPADARAIDRNPATAPAPVRLFVSYAHDDERLLKRLDCILDVLEQQHGLSSWSDKRLIAGEEWDELIRGRLEDMDIFLFIASAASLASPYIKDVELPKAKARHDAGEIEVVTVKLEACGSDGHPLLGLVQRLAKSFKSVAETSAKSTVWEQVRQDLLPVIERVREKKAKRKK